jgi:hypothetical protein
LEILLSGFRHTEATSMRDLFPSAGRDGADALTPATVPMTRGLVDKLRLTVPPSDRPTPVDFERYDTLAQAYLAAGGDPDAFVMDRPNGGAVVIRMPGGVIPADAFAESI